MHSSRMHTIVVKIHTLLGGFDIRFVLEGACLHEVRPLKNVDVKKIGTCINRFAYYFIHRSS